MTAAHNKSQAVRRETGRVLRFLAQQAGAAALHINGDEAMLVAPHGGRAKAGMRLLTALASAGLVAIAEDRISATREADAWLRRLDGDWDYRAQHQTLERRDIEIGGEWRSVLVNADESPLATLRRLKDRCGRNWICDEEWAAGERLRRDFHLAQMSPRVSANWEAAVPGRKRSGEAGGNAALTERALDARVRIDAALAAIGPELADVALDICCFLKGLEAVEHERQWPQRSAKLVLKLALGALARHYFPQSVQPRPRHALHWGSPDYRPTLDGRAVLGKPSGNAGGLQP